MLLRQTRSEFAVNNKAEIKISNLIFFPILNLANYLIDNIDGAVHLLLSNHHGWSQSQNISLDGFSGKPFLQTLEYDDFSFICRPCPRFAIGDQINTDMQSQAGNLAHETVFFSQIISNSSEKSSAKRAVKIVRSLRGRTPIRISEIPYIIEKHDEVDPKIFYREYIWFKY